MSTGPEGPGDLIEMLLHGMGVGTGQNHRGAGPPLRADRPEQIDRASPQVLDCPWLAGAPRPATSALVLLAEPHLVLEPDLDRRAGRQAGHDLFQTLGEGLFLIVSMTSGSCK